MFLRGKKINKPMTYQTAKNIFENILRNSDLIEKDKKGLNRIHIHTLRKYFFTRLLQPLGREVTEALMGHKEFQDSSYLRYTLENLQNFYIEVMNEVTVLAPSIRTINREIDDIVELKSLERVVDNAGEIILEEEKRKGKNLTDREKIMLLREHAEDDKALSKAMKEKAFVDMIIENAYINSSISDEEIEQKAQRFKIKDWMKALETVFLDHNEVDKTWKVSSNIEPAVLFKTKKVNNNNKKVIDEKELQNYLDEGWDIQTVLPSGKILVKK